jgi:hypothetical protein
MNVKIHDCALEWRRESRSLTCPAELHAAVEMRD